MDIKCEDVREQKGFQGTECLVNEELSSTGGRFTNPPELSERRVRPREGGMQPAPPQRKFHKLRN